MRDALPTELRAHVAQLGGKPEDGGSALAAMHRGWVAVKATLSTYDDLAVLEECERGEDAALATYRDALERTLPATDPHGGRAPVRGRQAQPRPGAPHARRAARHAEEPIVKRLAGSFCCLAMLALAAGCEPTGTPPKPKAGDVAPKAAERASGPTSLAPGFDDGAVRADARALRWVADTVKPGPVSPTGPLSAAERSFINEAAGIGLYEVEGGQMAAAKGTQPAVRAFGTMLVAQHRAAYGELQAVARANGITLPINVEADKRSKLDRLAQLSGAAFDREFVQTVGITDHEAAVARFTAVGRDVRDPSLKAWIDKTLPALQAHLQEARQLPMPPPG